MSAGPSRLVLLGHPVAHSLSPLFQNAALRTIGSRLVYEALDVAPDALHTTVRALAGQRAAGNATVPHKEALFALCDRRTALADRVAAVNTFWVDDDGALVGDNTDVGGFDALVTAVVGALPTGCRVALLGAGGSAAAVLTAIERWGGCEVALFNRTRGRPERLAARFPVVTRIATSTSEVVEHARLIVNATSIGLDGEAEPLGLTAVASDVAVIDLAYRRGRTPWVRSAQALGLRASDGLPMLLEQGALAFERWFHQPAPRDVMRRALA